MSTRRLAAALALVLAAASPLRAELLKLSRLEKPARRFAVRQDLFRSGEAPAPSRAQKAAAQAETIQQSIAEEIAQSVAYEGFILKNAKPLALLNVSGDFFTVAEGESILGKIRVLKITRQLVTIEYDGAPYEIRSKGD